MMVFMRKEEIQRKKDLYDYEADKIQFELKYPNVKYIVKGKKYMINEKKVYITRY